MKNNSNLVITLTVGESKRLIAKGIAKLLEPELKNRMIAIARGSTNAYIVEELLRKKIDKKSYVLGHICPNKINTSLILNKEPIRDVVLKNNSLIEITIVQSVKEMKEGDIFIKGANCLNYKEKVAGLLNGSLYGGTIGAVLPTIKQKNIRLIIPIGLEKCCSEPVKEIQRRLDPSLYNPNIDPLKGATYKNAPLRMTIMKGEIITEIESLKILTKAEATHISSGGIAGAEGGVTLYIKGSSENIIETKKLIESIHGEKPFIEN